jgi:hypothetical protein
LGKFISAIESFQDVYVVDSVKITTASEDRGSGKLMAEIILDGQAATLDVSQLDLARFIEGRLIREYNVV